MFKAHRYLVAARRWSNRLEVLTAVELAEVLNSDVRLVINDYVCRVISDNEERSIREAVDNVRFSARLADRLPDGVDGLVVAGVVELLADL